MNEDAARRRPSKVSDADVLARAQDAKNLRQLLRALGLAAYGGNYEAMRKRLSLLGITDARFHPMPKREALRRFAYAELQAAARRSDSFAQMLRLLEVPVTPAAHRRIKNAAERFGIDTTHFVGQAHNRGQRFPGRGAPLLELLVAGKATSTIALKRRLLASGLLPRCCAMCECYEWNDEPIPLELDHINGDRLDNRLENLRLLCPNCHAQTPTYRGRNIGRPAVLAPDSASEVPDLAGDAHRRLRSVIPPRCVA